MRVHRNCTQQWCAIVITESFKFIRNHLQQEKYPGQKLREKDVECHINQLLREFTKVMFGAQRQQCGFKYHTAPTADIYSPKCTGAVPGMQVLSPQRTTSKPAAAHPIHLLHPANNALKPSHRIAGVKPSTTKSQEEMSMPPDTFLAQPKPISVSYKHDYKIPV